VITRLKGCIKKKEKILPDNIGGNVPAPIPEKAGIVIGGPLDPTSPEGQPPEGQTVNSPAMANTPATIPLSNQPLYKGLMEIKTQEELLTYVKGLEGIIASNASKGVNPTIPNSPPAPIGPSNKERFSELIYSKPDEAFELAVQEAESRMQKKEDARRDHEQFWGRFYSENPDLAKVKDIVQLTLGQHSAVISNIRTQKEVGDYLAKESRKVIDQVKRSVGVTETVVPSGAAVALGGSGEIPPAPLLPVAQPKNFTSQVIDLRPKGKVRAPKA